MILDGPRSQPEHTKPAKPLGKPAAKPPAKPPAKPAVAVSKARLDGSA